ncbi:MAG: ATP-dependent DNA helicase [Chloroflexota bacterium]
MSPFTPTDEQKSALGTPTPLLVLAGAGTGKTTVLTRRIAGTILAGEARPDQVLALTFTDKAAAEMAERLAAVMAEAGQGEAAREVAVQTFHSFGGQLIRENALRLGFDRPPAVLTTASGWRLLASFFDELRFDAIALATGQVATVFARLLGFFSRCKDHLVDPDRLDSFLASQEPGALALEAAEHWGMRLGEWRDAARAYRRYEQAKREAGLIDFGDLLMLPVQLLQGDPALRAACRDRYRHLFVDEYQDTNHAQRTLLLELLDPAAPRLMVIGDDDQGIYRWRGAVVQNILRLHEEAAFHQAPVTRVPMTLNRRSFPPILDLANRAIACVNERHAKELDYHPNNIEGQATVGHYVAACDAAEARWLAAQLQELAPRLAGLPGPKRGYGACAVLCRKRRLFEPVGRALDEAGVPYELIGGTGFYGRWELRDIISYLRVLARASDDAATARLLRSARWRLGGRDIHHLGRWVAKQNGGRGREGAARPEGARYHLFDAMRRAGEVAGLSASARERLGRLTTEIDGYAAARGRVRLPELVTLIIDGTGYRGELAARPGFDTRVALLNLAKLEHMADAFAAGAATTGLGEFVEYVTYALESGEEEDEVRPLDEGSNTVKVMTVHQAKGLEFPVVFVPGLAHNVFPSQRKDETQKWWQLPWELRGDREHLPRLDYGRCGSKKELEAALKEQAAAEKELQLDEERRLFYVALTRAQRQLYLSRAHWYGDTVKPRPGSEFWELAVASGLASDLGEEDCPAANPNEASAATAAGGTQPAGAAEMALLLSGATADDWSSNAARQEGPTAWAARQAEVDEHLRRVGLPLATPAPETELETSVSGLLLYQTCPRHYRYVYVDRLPVRPSAYAALGRAVHRRIEALSRPTEAAEPVAVGTPAPDEEAGRELEHEVEELVEAKAGAAGVAPGARGMEGLVARFRASTYGRRPATYVEWPFVLPLAGGLIRGRVDRLDRLPDGRWQLVDFKSGAYRAEAAAAYAGQLRLYALAAHRTLGVAPDQLSAHVLFLADGHDLAVPVDQAALGAAAEQAGAALRDLAAGAYPCRRREDCPGCDYAHLCEDD